MAKTPNVAPGQALTKKLSISGLGYTKPILQKLVLSDDKADHFLARFVGVATAPRPYKIKEGDRAGQTAYGLMGQFEGTNADGEVITSAVCYLPEYATEMVIAALASGEDVVSVNVAFDVYARYDESSATSYVFTVRDLLNQGASGVDETKAMIAALPMPPKMLAISDQTA